MLKSNSPPRPIRRRMGRGGELDFSIDRVQLVDGNWVNVRHTPIRKHGAGSGAKMGILTAGLSAARLPAAPIGLMMKGQDVEILQGHTFDVYAEGNAPAPVQEMAAAPATLSITASVPGADIEIDGVFVGNAPSTVQVAPGVHQVVVRQGAATWQRNLQATGGNVTINAMLPVVQGSMQ